MTRNEAINYLGQLIMEASHRNCFGLGSHTVLKLRVAQQIAIKEARMYSQAIPPDQQEYEVAHAGQRSREAAAINKDSGTKTVQRD